MTTVFTTPINTGAGFDDKPVVQRQADAANQRESWLRQMELAQLTDMGKAGVTAPGAQPAPVRLPTAPLRAMPQPQQGQQHDDDKAEQRTEEYPAEREAAAQQARAEVQDSVPDNGQVRAEAAPPAAGSDAAPVAAGTPAAAASAASHPQASASHVLAAATTDGAVAAPVPGAAVSVIAAPAATAAAATVMAGTPHAGAAVTHDGDALTAPAAALREASRALAGAAPHPGELPHAEADAPDAPAPAARGEEEQFADKPVWQKRMMHLNGKGDDVDLYIRDSALDAAESQKIIARVAADMAGMGLRLKGATVNGKPALRPDDARAAAALDLDTEPDSDPHHTPITFSGKNHGTR